MVFTWIYLNIPEFTRVFLNLLQFTWVYLTLPEFTWIGSLGVTWVHLGWSGWIGETWNKMGYIGGTRKPHADRQTDTQTHREFLQCTEILSDLITNQCLSPIYVYAYIETSYQSPEMFTFQKSCTGKEVLHKRGIFEDKIVVWLILFQLQDLHL